jgi:hypothetical protein
MFNPPKLFLPYVQLVCIDNLHIEKAKAAIDRCTSHIDFAEVTFIHDAPVRSKEDYSRFVMKELVDFINYPYVMICQYDGFVINPYLWQDRFLEYDYIGAPWWYDFHNVGNGGLSIRSHELMQEIAKDEYEITHPEDDVIGRRYRSQLERKGFLFAPEWLAKQFSFEPNPKYRDFKNNTFGCHAVKELYL